eukprot:s2270_g10.t1
MFFQGKSKSMLGWSDASVQNASSKPSLAPEHQLAHCWAALHDLRTSVNRGCCLRTVWPLAMTRIRTGIARRPDGPEDANPMNRRLPAEVVSRRKGENRAHPGKAVKEEVAPSHLSTDLKQVLAMKPEGRSKWLAKAVQQAHPQDGRLSPKSIYDIIAHAKFANDLNEKVGQRMYRVLHANLSLFSTKQQKFLEKECALAKQFAVAAFAPAPGAEEEDTTAADAMEDMMARCRAFVRERQSERGERNLEGDEAEAEAAEAAEIPPGGAPQAPQAPDAKQAQATQDEANAEPPFEQPISQAEPQKEADGHLTRASKSRSRSRSSPSKTKAQGASMDATAGSEEKDVKDAKDEASKLKKASKPESKENGKGKTSEKPKSKEGKDTKDTKASDKAKKSKDEVSRNRSRETKTKNAKSSKEKAKESRRRENHKRRSSSSRSSRGRARDESESSRSRRRSDKRRGKSRNSSDSSFVSRKRGRSSSRPKRRR